MTDTNSHIAEIVNSNDVVLFMKGTPLFPQCGFSSRAVAILDHLGVAFVCRVEAEHPVVGVDLLVPPAREELRRVGEEVEVR